ncbi:response regulator transcription factor [Actinomycetospora endophytica]|uniref:Response regulator transcription factor n=1 Tax=Actinomycetospora endophytica TaxID=2291215 RepID=A0ABS8PFB6_9PSEU|nr:response regulator transcription factor [Actinomycetospora endophytica]MCD2196106.1 response regulator transcription factor [Actinomycetospora endophytica]
MIDVLIGDGRFLYADLLSSLLTEHGYGPIVTIGGPDDLLTEVRRRRPSMCLVDHRSLAGAEHDRFLDTLIAAASDSTKIVVMSTGPALTQSARTADRPGVDGVFDKRASLQTLIDGLRSVLDGEVVTVAPIPVEPPTPEDVAWFRRRAAELTPRERECLALLVEGQTTEQIQRTLSVSVMTVRSHVRSVLRKLGAHSRLEAASLAVRHELLADEFGGSRAG